MANATFLNFSYGSNMFTPRLRARCPSVKPLGLAVLSGAELRWHKVSKDHSAKCDISLSDLPESRVFGVLYEVATSEKQRLDEAEGLGNGYKAIDVRVLHNGEEVVASAYRATNIDPSLKPYSWYQALVVAGAKEHGLPIEYIAHIERVTSIEDPDRARHAKNMSLIDGAQA